MTAKLRILATGIGAFVLLGFSEPQPPQPSASIPNWLLVDEIVVDEPPEFRSDLFFADQASITQGDTDFTISISHIILTEAVGTSSQKDQIVDMRSQMTIDCRKRVYRVTETSQYNGEEELVTAVTSDENESQWQRPESDAGLAKVIKLVCEANTGSGAGNLPSHLQPLTALLAYLNADWSK